LTLQDVVQALERNNANVGAGYIERRGEQYLVRAPGRSSRSTTSRRHRGHRARPADPHPRLPKWAWPRAAHRRRHRQRPRSGAGHGFMLIGENSRAVSQAVDARMAVINKSLPAGVKAVTVYDRTNLVDKAIATVKKNLLEGAVLVIAILFLFLGNLRAALITAMVIPLSMLFTFTGMVSYKISANLMSLGALDFGIIVDGAVVIVENCVRRLAHAKERLGRPLTRAERFEEVFAAASEARRPLVFGQLIIMIVYIPIFALTGVKARCSTRWR
jgi:cobalt-zinc-cadmium resistance protein CzcA